jgi:bifunctional DNA-binding transcriptional regulator/antitoxin component of YhaV-PrlF toxin-antitoxin module
MSRVTSKLQVTLPKAVATAHGITAGSDVTFESSGSVIVLRPGAAPARTLSVDERLALFDAATQRLQGDCAPDESQNSRHDGRTRGWSRDELYSRGSES